MIAARTARDPRADEARQLAYQCAHPDAGPEEWRKISVEQILQRASWAALVFDNNPPVARLVVETFGDKLPPLPAPLHVTHNCGNILTQSILRKWNLQEWMVVFKNGIKSDNGVCNLETVNIRDALAHIDKSDWDVFLTREERRLVMKHRWRAKLKFSNL
jgi:hypothetical protein